MAVTTAEGTEGWVRKAYLTMIAASGVADTSGPFPGPSTTIAVATRAFDGCPLEGTAKGPTVQHLNDSKNRSASPTNADIDTAVTLAAMLRPGDDAARWDTSRAAEVVGYVHNIKVGGIETTNCRATDPVHRDTHIELVVAPDDSAPTRRVIVEVTPRWRAAEQIRGVDWSTAHLRSTILHKWVKVRGWLLFDVEHASQAANTAPDNPADWRATVWEIHPITDLSVVPAPQ